MVSATSCISNATLSGMFRGDRSSLGNRIVLSFGVLFVLMVTMAAVSYNRLRAIDREALSPERDSVPGLHLSASLRATTRNSHATLEHALFVDIDPELINRDLERAAQLMCDLDKYSTDYESTIYRDNDRQHFHVYRAVVDKYLPMFNEAMQLARTSKPVAQATVRHAMPVWEETTVLADKLIADNRVVVDESARQTRASVQSTEITLAVVLGVVLLITLVLDYTLFKAITVSIVRVVDAHDDTRTGNLAGRLDLRRNDEFGTLKEGFNRTAKESASLVPQAQKLSSQVMTSVIEIAAAFKEQQTVTAETAVTTTGIGATSRKVFATSRNLLCAMNEVSSVAEQSATLAGASQSGLNRMEDTMYGVMEAVGSVNAKLAIPNEKAININQVVSTITKVADQTDLLLLNAAIEAEEAGEYGRNFAVVATEIRRLVDQTAVATYDIEQTVKEVQSAVSIGVMGMDKFSEEVRRSTRDVQQVGMQLSQITIEVQALASRFQMMNEGMQTQATGAEQITQASSQLSEAAQQTAESLRQSSQAVDDLMLVVNQLRIGASRFKIGV